MVGKYRAVTAPVAVEPHAPEATCWQPHPVGVVATVGKIDDHYYVVARASLIPAVKCEKLVGVVDVVHVHVLRLEPPRGVEPIAPHSNQVAVVGPVAVEPIALRPIELTCIRPRARLQEFLPHEDHGNAGDGK